MKKFRPCFHRKREAGAILRITIKRKFCASFITNNSLSPAGFRENRVTIKEGQSRPLRSLEQYAVIMDARSSFQLSTQKHLVNGTAPNGIQCKCLSLNLSGVYKKPCYSPFLETFANYAPLAFVLQVPPRLCWHFRSAEERHTHREPYSLTKASTIHRDKPFSTD